MFVLEEGICSVRCVATFRQGKRHLAPFEPMTHVTPSGHPKTNNFNKVSAVVLVLNTADMLMTITSKVITFRGS